MTRRDSLVAIRMIGTYPHVTPPDINAAAVAEQRMLLTENQGLPASYLAEDRTARLTRKGWQCHPSPTVIETPDFVSDAKHAGMSQEEVEAIVLHLGKNPQAGGRISRMSTGKE